MGNQFSTNFNPQSGQVCTIIDTPYTVKEKIPKEVYGQGLKVKILGSKDLLCSRSELPKVKCSLIQFPNGRTDVYFTNSLRPAQN
jgi:hypothetical protein